LTGERRASDERYLVTPTAPARILPNVISSFNRSLRLGKSTVGPASFDATADVACH
jgi:hypothetical protein